MTKLLGQIMINSNTLYYTFSTIPQILGTLVALLAAFVHFRITRLEDYLVGDGQAVFNRLGETGYILPAKQQKRLQDAIGRKNIYEIKAVLKILNDIEKKEGFTKETRKTGLQVIFEDRFGGTQRQIEKLKTLTLRTAAIAIITIALSLVSLSFVDIISICNCYSVISLIINTTLTIITLVLSFTIIYQGLMKKTLLEMDID